MGAPFVTPALLAHWAVHAALVGAYAGFRQAYEGTPAVVRSPSYLIQLGVVPQDWTQEVDILFFTLLLAGQKYRRSANVNEFVSTLVWYLQLAVAALLALTAARPCVAYVCLLLAGWALAPAPPLPLGRLGFCLLTPYELAVMASRRVQAAGSFVRGASAGGGGKQDVAIVVAAAHRNEEAALSAREAFRGEPTAQLWYGDLGVWPELASSLQVDCSLLSLELPSVLLVAPNGTGRPAKRLPLKSEGSEAEGGGHVRTVRMSAANLRRYFAVGHLQ